MPHGPPSGNSDPLKDKLIQQALERRLRQAAQADPQPSAHLPTSAADPDGMNDRFKHLPGYRQLRIIQEGAARLGIESPYFKPHEGVAGATTWIDGKEYINFASNNYLGLNGHPAVNEAAAKAIRSFGTSVSASRMVSGERPVHRELEKALARAYEVEDAVVFVSGHATNVTSIGCLFGPRDLILHDQLIHNSVLQGAQLSGARRMSFPHNDWSAADGILTDRRRQFERVLIVLEGVYSMDGDYPDLPRFVELKNRHRAFLMVDEGHSFGVMGKTGLGIREHFGLRGCDVDIWMGTLSKALVGCGGFIAGESALVEYLKHLAPGFLYSVGLSPPLAAASLAALQCLLREPERSATLRDRGRLFLDRARLAGIDTGTSAGLAIIPAIVGSSLKAVRLSATLFERGINVQPILYPAVPEKTARLRFSLSCLHTEKQIVEAIGVLSEEIR